MWYLAQCCECYNWLLDAVSWHHYESNMAHIRRYEKCHIILSETIWSLIEEILYIKSVCKWVYKYYTNIKMFKFKLADGCHIENIVLSSLWQCHSVCLSVWRGYSCQQSDSFLTCVAVVGSVVIRWTHHGWIYAVNEESCFCPHVLSRCLYEDDRWQFQTKYVVMSSYVSVGQNSWRERQVFPLTNSCISTLQLYSPWSSTVRHFGTCWTAWKHTKACYTYDFHFYPWNFLLICTVWC